MLLTKEVRVAGGFKGALPGRVVQTVLVTPSYAVGPTWVITVGLTEEQTGRGAG